MENSLNISQLFGDSWSLFKKHWKMALLVTVITFAIQMIFNSFGYNTDPVTQVATGSLWVTGVGMVVSLILGIGTINIFLGLSRGEDKHIKELVTTVTFKKFFVYLIASILYGVMMFVGLILLIIPGLIVVSIFLPYVYFIVDKDAGIIDSLKQAAGATKGNRINVFLVFVCLTIFNILGVMFLFVGLLVTIPMSMFVMALMYRELTGEAYVSEDGDKAATAEETTE